MIDHAATDIFVKLDDFMIAAINGKNGPESAGSENEKWLFRLKNRNKDRKLCLSEAACLLMLFQLSTCQSLKMFLFFNGRQLAAMFPNLPSYATCVSWLARTEAFLVDFIHANLAKPGDRNSVYAIDSTKIDPHKLKNNPKCMRANARIGHSHEGMWLGWKLHVLANRAGEIVAWDWSGGNAHDLAPVKGGMLRGICGKCFADSGYVSAQVRQDLLPQDLLFIAKPTKAMADARWIFDKFWAAAYRQRQVVEGVFSRLKSRLGLVAQGARSPASARCRALASVALHCLGF